MVCAPCDLKFLHWGGFMRHMHNAHHIDLALLRQRMAQCGYQPVTAVLTQGGRWMLMVQAPLGL